MGLVCSKGQILEFVEFSFGKKRFPLSDSRSG